MPAPFQCPHCQTQLRVPEQYGGKKVRCPKCGALLDVPEDEALAPPQPVMLELDEQPSPPVTESPEESRAESDDWEQIGSAVRSERIGLKKVGPVGDPEARERGRRPRRGGQDGSGFEGDETLLAGPLWRPLADGVRWMEFGVLALVAAMLLIFFGDYLITTTDRAAAATQKLYSVWTSLFLMVLGVGFFAVGHYRSRVRPTRFVGAVSRLGFWFIVAAVMFAIAGVAADVYAIYGARDARSSVMMDNMLEAGTTGKFLTFFFLYMAQTLFLLVVQRAAAARRSASISVGAIFLLIVTLLCAALVAAVMASQINDWAHGNIGPGSRRSSRKPENSTLTILWIIQGVLILLYVVVLESVRSLVRREHPDGSRPNETGSPLILDD